MAYDARNFVLNRYLSSPEITPLEFRVLAILGEKINVKDRGIGQRCAWPSLRTLARLAGASKQGVLNALTRLQELNIVEIVNRTSNGKAARSNEYFLVGFEEYFLERERNREKKAAIPPLRLLR